MRIMQIKPLLLLLLLLCFAPSAVVAGETKIGFVFAQKVMEQSPQAEQVQKALQKEFDPRKKELDEMQKQVKKLEDRLSRDSAVMSEAERLKQEREFRALSREFKRASEEFNEDLVIRKNQALERLRKRLFEVIQVIAEKNKFDLIVSEGGVLYASDPINITDLVLKELEKEINGKGSTKSGKPKS